jgi:Uma2 family endonuclease
MNKALTRAPRSKTRPATADNDRNPLLTTCVVEDETIHIPGWVVDLTSFRRWVHGDDFPETGRICFLDGEVWVDMSKEQFFSHNQARSEYNIVLGGLCRASKRGRYVPEGMLLTHVAANLTAQPDGCFFFHETLSSGRLRLVEGKKGGFVELEGTPDMALEVVSDSSEEKDLDTLFDLYRRAGIAEYWLVDVRGDRLVFDIYRHTSRGYVAVRKQAGWLKSTVFGKSFRLTRQTDAQGHPEYTLEVRD